MIGSSLLNDLLEITDDNIPLNYIYERSENAQYRPLRHVRNENKYSEELLEQRHTLRGGQRQRFEDLQAKPQQRFGLNHRAASRKNGGACKKCIGNPTWGIDLARRLR